MTNRLQALSFAALFAVASAPAARAADAPGNLGGVVVDGARKPVAGITVRATDVVDPSKAFTTTSGQDGRFSIAQLPAASYLVSAETVNTSWIQKDDSPIIEVSSAASPAVTLVLLRSAELAPSSGGGEGSSLHGATLGVAAVGVGVGIIGLVQNEDLQDDNDQLEEDLNQTQDEIIRSQQKAKEQYDELNRQLRLLQEQQQQQSQQNQQLLDQNQDLQEQIADLQDQIADLQEQVDRIPVSPSR